MILTKAPKSNRPVAQLAEHRSPKPEVGGSIPSWPVILILSVTRNKGSKKSKNEEIFSENFRVF